MNLTSLTNPALDWLWRCTLEGTLLIALVLCVRWAFGQHLGPRWRIALWALVGVKLLLPASLSFLPGIGTLQSDSAVREPATIAVVVAISASDAPYAAADSALPLLGNTGPDTATNSVSLSSLITFSWIAGAVLFLTVAAVRQASFSRKIRHRRCRDRQLLNSVRSSARECGLRHSVPVYLDKPGSTPAVFGVFQPSLLLPGDWAERFDEQNLRHILLHELEHVRVGDVIWNWTATLVNALHWFNPLAWIATSHFQSDRELRCDADTLSRLAPTERLAYGHTLLNIQQNYHAAPAIAGLAPCVRNHPTLRQRITMITHPTTRKTWLNPLFAAAVVGLICVSFGAAQADEERGNSRESARDGDAPREGERAGDKPREGDRDGDKPREGSRDGARDRENP